MKGQLEPTKDDLEQSVHPPALEQLRDPQYVSILSSPTAADRSAPRQSSSRATSTCAPAVSRSPSRPSLLGTTVSSVRRLRFTFDAILTDDVVLVFGDSGNWGQDFLIKGVLDSY